MRKLLLGLVVMVFVSYTSTKSLNAQNEAECITIETNTRILYLHKNSKVRVHYSGGKIHSRIKSIGNDNFTINRGNKKIMFDDIEKMRVYNYGKWSFLSGIVGVGYSALRWRLLRSIVLFQNGNASALGVGLLGEASLYLGLGAAAIGIPYAVMNLATSKVVKKSADKGKHNIQSIEKGEHKKEYIFQPKSFR